MLLVFFNFTLAWVPYAMQKWINAHAHLCTLTLFSEVFLLDRCKKFIEFLLIIFYQSNMLVIFQHSIINKLNIPTTLIHFSYNIIQFIFNKKDIIAERIHFARWFISFCFLRCILVIFFYNQQLPFVLYGSLQSFL